MRVQISLFIVIVLVGCATPQPNNNYLNISGDWELVANSNPGKLEIRESAGKLTGRVWFQKLKRWENLTRLSFVGNTLKFARGHQKYTAVYKAGNLIGTFATLGRTYDWKANKI